MEKTKAIFKIIIIALPERFKRVFYVLGDTTVEENKFFKESKEKCIDKMTQWFISNYQCGGGRFKDRWEIESIEYVGEIYEGLRAKEMDNDNPTMKS